MEHAGSPGRLAVRVVDVYPYRLSPPAPPRFLLMQRAEGSRYAGQWRMVGGKIEEGETAWQAALRELGEETGRLPRRLWCLPSVNLFYEWQHDRVNVIPAFAAEIDADPVLDREHVAFQWLPAQAAVALLAWPEQQRLLLLADRLLREGIPPDLVLPGNVVRPDETAGRKTR